MLVSRGLDKSSWYFAVTISTFLASAKQRSMRESTVPGCAGRWEDFPRSDAVMLCKPSRRTASLTAASSIVGRPPQSSFLGAALKSSMMTVSPMKARGQVCLYYLVKEWLYPMAKRDLHVDVVQLPAGSPELKGL